MTMDFFDVLKKRHSIRNYDPRPIEPGKLQRVLQAALMAPTSLDKREFRIIVLNTANFGNRLRKIYDEEWFPKAPTVLAIVSTHDKQSFSTDFGEVDGSIIMSHIILAATAEGLGTCWVGLFNTWKAAEILKLPENVEPIAFTPIGYSKEPEGEGVKILPRLQDFVMHNEWEESKAPA
ncbi:nitroreductase family protein [Planctomycetota bacterium]